MVARIPRNKQNPVKDKLIQQLCCNCTTLALYKSFTYLLTYLQGWIIKRFSDAFISHYKCKYFCVTLHFIEIMILLLSFRCLLADDVYVTGRTSVFCALRRV